MKIIGADHTSYTVANLERSLGVLCGFVRLRSVVAAGNQLTNISAILWAFPIVW